MAKAIKRVGVIFLAVAIICLMAIGVLLGVTGAKSETAGSLNLNNEIENNLQIAVDKSYTLSGTNAQMAETWNEAVKYSKDNGGVNVNVTLNANWTAQNDATWTTAFGSGDGFSEGRIFVPAGAMITLDLNGKTINRNLSVVLESGSVFFLNGSLIVKDKLYNSEKMISECKKNYTNDLIQFGAGGITGGNSNCGGGIYLLENATFVLESGMIFNNKAYLMGAGIYSPLPSNLVVINDGLIAGNIARGESADGGGILAHCNVYVNGGIFHSNFSEDAGGAIRIVQGEVVIAGGIIANNDTTNPSKAAIFIDNAVAKIRGGIITKNLVGVYICVGKPGVIHLGAGAQVYGNNIADIRFDEDRQIVIDEPLMQEGKTTHVGIDAIANPIFTTNYKMHNGNIAPSRFFFSNKSDKIIALSGNEAVLTTGTAVTSKLTWSWSGAGTGSTTESNAVVPYTGSSYRISVSSGTIKNSDGSNNVSVSAPGTYAFYVDGNYLNPTFMFTIKGGTIAVPTQGNNTFTYNGSSQTYDLSSYGFDSKTMNIYNNVATNAGKYYAIVAPKANYKWQDGTQKTILFEYTIKQKKLTKPTTDNNVLIYENNGVEYLPQGFDTNVMSISNNIKKDVGKYTASVSLKDNKNYCWEDGSIEDKEYPFEIIHPGVVLKDNSNFDYIYKDSNNLRQSYKDNKIIHKVSESETTSNYVIGNIAPKTTIKQFVGDIRKECGYIKIYNGNTMLYDGTTEIEASDSIYVATGYRLELYKNSNGTELLDTVYLSVLGDVVADGVINTLDITYINRIAKGEIKLETLSIEQQLAAMVDNKGKVTSTDGKILLNVIGGNTEVDNYFENVTQKDDYQILVLNSTSGKTYRQNMNLTTLNVYDNAIIGNIATKTKVNEFKTKLANQTSANISDIAIYKANGAVASDNDYIGTGYYISYAGKTIYLSVLGDLTGDGIVNTMDVTCLNRIISGNVKLNTNEIKDKLTMLSAIIQNKGNLTTADSETLLNYIGGNADMTKYF